MAHMATTPKPKHKNNIFDVLNHASTKDVEYYAGLAEDQQKALQPLLLQRWMSGTSSAQQVYLLNEVVNPYVFSLFRHKDLLWKLLTVASSGRAQRYTWLSQKSDAGRHKPIATKVVSEYYKYNIKHATDAVKLLSYEQVAELAHDLGYQPDVIAKLKKEYDANGSKSK